MKVERDYIITSTLEIKESKCHKALLRHEPVHEHSWKFIGKDGNSIFTHSNTIETADIIFFKDDMLAAFQAERQRVDKLLNQDRPPTKLASN